VVRGVHVGDRGHGRCMCDFKSSADTSSEYFDIVFCFEVAGP
jgi:hypothetical protein